MALPALDFPPPRSRRVCLNGREQQLAGGASLATKWASSSRSSACCGCPRACSPTRHGSRPPWSRLDFAPPRPARDNRNRSPLWSRCPRGSLTKGKSHGDNEAQDGRGSSRVVKGCCFVLRMPADGGGRIVIGMNARRGPGARRRDRGTAPDSSDLTPSHPPGPDPVGPYPAPGGPTSSACGPRVEAEPRHLGTTPGDWGRGAREARL